MKCRTARDGRSFPFNAKEELRADQQPFERALNADIPVVIAVSSHRFADWIKFAGGMTVNLSCDRKALDAWWRSVSLRTTRGAIDRDCQTICEVLK
jgi:hypothetical protein